MVAESNRQMAAAYTKMAENDEKRLLINERRLLNDEKLVDLFSTVIYKLN